MVATAQPLRWSFNELSNIMILTQSSTTNFLLNSSSTKVLGVFFFFLVEHILQCSFCISFCMYRVGWMEYTRGGIIESQITEQILHCSELSHLTNERMDGGEYFAYLLRGYSKRAFRVDNGSIEWMG